MKTKDKSWLKLLHGLWLSNDCVYIPDGRLKDWLGQQELTHSILNHTGIQFYEED